MIAAKRDASAFGGGVGKHWMANEALAGGQG